VLDELEKAGLVTLADKGYQGGTWAKVPCKGKGKPEPQKEANRAHARLRAPASERTRSSRHGGSSASSAVAPAGKLALAGQLFPSHLSVGDRIDHLLRGGTHPPGDVAAEDLGLQLVGHLWVAVALQEIRGI
jgi:hypothetical protein